MSDQHDRPGLALLVAPIGHILIYIMLTYAICLCYVIVPALLCIYCLYNPWIKLPVVVIPVPRMSFPYLLYSSAISVI